MCQEGWTGTFCEHDVTTEPVHILRLFLTLVVLIGIVAVLVILIRARTHGNKMTETEKLLFFRRLRFCLPEEDIQ